jgi:hypothetical protein
MVPVEGRRLVEFEAARPARDPGRAEMLGVADTLRDVGPFFCVRFFCGEPSSVDEFLLAIPGGVIVLSRIAWLPSL